VKAKNGSEFQLALSNTGVRLSAGEYVLIIDPVWNKQASFEKAYKDVLIDIYST